MKVYLAQVNPTVADLKGNVAMMRQQILLAAQDGCDVVLFPELVTTAYPPRDYLYEQWIWDAHPKIADDLLSFLKGLDRQITIIYGGLHERQRSHGVYDRFNSAYVVDRVAGIRIIHKRLLPQYDVFDESRYFTPALDEPYRPITLYIDNGRGGVYQEPCDVLICEDIWNNRFSGDARHMPSAYNVDPVGEILEHDGPLFVLNGSPFWQGKVKTTEKLIRAIQQRIQRPVCWVNQVGAHNDIITGGYSMVCADDDFRRGALFAEDAIIVTLADQNVKKDKFNRLWENGGDKDNLIRLPGGGRPVVEPEDLDAACDYLACLLHIEDYCRRTGFKKIVFGSSGGIDSAVVGALACDAIGYKNVTSIGMPSQYSSEGSVADAKELAQKTGMRFVAIPIKSLYDEMRKLFLSGGQKDFNSSLTDENIQPRLRANILMTYSNDMGALLLTTGNKSEITVGYCTLYGDTCGGIAVISDLWKTEVYRLARFINKYRGDKIPVEIIDKPPSAELKPDQQDTDSLPEYDKLDPLLRLFVEKGLTPECIIRECADEIGKTLPTKDQIRLMYGKYRMSEYKRQQLGPGPKLKDRSFGSGRRMPIAASPTNI